VVQDVVLGECSVLLWRRAGSGRIEDVSRGGSSASEAGAGVLIASALISGGDVPLIVKCVSFTSSTSEIGRQGLDVLPYCRDG
jgi:hypothetical protein